MNKNIVEIRAKLYSEEKKLLNDLGEESSILESKIRVNLKTGAYMLGGVLAGITVYKIFSSDKKSPEMKPKKLLIKKSRAVKSGITNTLISFVAGQIIPVVIKKINKELGINVRK